MSGPFFFAWVEEYETSFGPEHEREDEDLFSLLVEHNENDIPTLTVEIINPRIGLLAPGRKQWAWLSWQSSSGVIPLFFGRIVGIPNGINQEIVTIVFSARATDYSYQKLALAGTLKVAPYWDEVFIDQQRRDDPDAVLEARSELWHVDRTSLELTVSDIIVGEDGLVDFPSTDVFYDSVEITLNEAPLRSITIDASVSWKQEATGTIDLRPGVITSATGEGLLSEWPKIGARFDGGWSVASGSAVDNIRLDSFPSDYWTGKGFNTPEKPQGWYYLEIRYETIGFGGQPASILHEGVLVPRSQISTQLTLQYDASRERTERVMFTMSTSLQPIVTIGDEPELLTVNGADVGLPIEYVIPIVDVARRSYYPTDRGLQSIEYLIALGRAHLLARARAVQISWECPFDLAIGLSCRMNARIFDHRLPGGEALGKIISYSFSANVQEGKLVGTVVIGCAIGYGDDVAALPGTPDYVNVGYVDLGYQTYTGQTVLLGSGDITYTVPIDDPQDDGLNLVGGLTREDAIVSYSVTNQWDQQIELIRQALRNIRNTDEAIAAAQAILEANPTMVSFTLVPVDNGPFELLYPITTSLLTIPKQIDMESAS